jgi:6-pyruvoyltetrahydropterin/6-carboxytetrahydropterin synthase
MIVDTGILERNIADVQRSLDHKFLNRIETLGTPTLENLARFIWDHVGHAGRVARVTVYRDSCNEACSYYGPAPRQGVG